MIMKRHSCIHTLGWLSLSLGLAACGDQAQQNLVVEGTILHAKGKQVMLAELPYASPNRIVVDSAAIDSNGHFRLQSVQSQQNIYQLFVVNGPGILLINDANNLQVEMDADAPEKYVVNGSAASNSIKALYEQFTPLYKQWQLASTKAEASLQDKNLSDSLRSVALQQRDEAHAALKGLFKNYLSSQPNSTARYFALGMARQFLSPSDWAAQLQLADSLFPSHPGITLLKVNAASSTVQGSHLLNKPVPELTLPDSTGKLVSVSAFRGRWLLIDCWASWCAPCRKENPNILAAWRKYNKKGFSVLGVSLDKDRAAWINAIKSDSLQWQHVSDLKYWDSRAVAAFDIQSLPFNLLVDPKGEVKAINLTDSLLDKTLNSFIK